MKRHLIRSLVRTCAVTALVTSGMGGGVTLGAQQTVAAVQSTPDLSRVTQEMLARQVTITLVNVSRITALDSLSRVSKIFISYHPEMLSEFTTEVNVHAVGMPLGAVLNQVLEGTGLYVTSNGHQILMVMPVNGTSLKDSTPDVGTVTGSVVDSVTGRGTAGVTVNVVGTKLAAVTRDDGRFTLSEIPVGQYVLTAKLFGYRPVSRDIEIKAGQITTVHMQMVSAPNVLSGVVTTAAGLQRRVEVGNDITVLHPDSIQQVAPVSTLTQLLETRVPGLIVQHTSGIPGAPSRLRIRGLSSINQSGDPIVIVDGIRVYSDQSGSVSENGNMNNGQSGSNVAGTSSVGVYAGPSAMDQIDPNNIETIEVFKGPSATAIYGSDAANGVIVITTKRGHVGPTQWNLALDQGRTTLSGHWPVQYFGFGRDLDPFYGNVTRNCSGIDLGFNVNCAQDSVIAFQTLNNPLYSPLTGRPGTNQDLSLTVSGGSGALTYAVTGSASTQRGYLHLPPIEVTRFQEFHGFPAPQWMQTPDNYTTYSGNSQLNVQLGKSSGSLALSSQLFRSAQQQSSLQQDLEKLSTMYVDTLQLASEPLIYDYYTRAQLNTTTFTNAVTLNNFAPWSWLPLTATAGLSVQDQNNNTLLPRDYITCAGSGAQGSSCGGDSLGAYQLTQGTNTSGSLSVGTTIAMRRLVNTALGVNVYTVALSNYAASTIGLPLGATVPSTFTYLCSTGCGPGYSTANAATYGWYVQPTFNLNSRFFVSPGFRLDGGSNSGTNGSAGHSVLSPFPKLDFSWLAVSRPASDPFLGALTLLRPRIAFGIAGVQPGPAETLRLLQPAESVPLTGDGSTGTPEDILNVATIGNPLLRPERDRELEGGVDAEFGNQRLRLTLTGHHKVAYDAILAIPVAPSVLPTGTAKNVNENIGNIRNTGIEASVFARLIDSRPIDWTMNMNLTRNRNLLLSLAPGIPNISISGDATSYRTRLVPGYPLFGLWARPIVGFTGSSTKGGVFVPSQIVVGDSEVYVGAPQPDYEMTWSTTLALLNHRLVIDASADYQSGLTQVNSSGSIEQIRNLSNDPTQTPATQAAIYADLHGITEIQRLQTVNTLRWNTLSATYLIPARLTRMMHVPYMSLSLQGSNLLLHTNYRGKDPGVNDNVSGNSTSDNGSALPQPRVWNLRMTIRN